jgi:hypothetical protein
MASLRAALSLGRHRVDTASDVIELIDRLHGAARACAARPGGTRQDGRVVHDRNSGKERGPV